MPWKNGGGTTTEIAVSPQGAGLDDFDWRISMARIEADGPFSAFAGVDRTLSILEGAGIVLDVARREAVALTAESVPFSFPADVATDAKLLGGAVTDLNVMTRRGGMRHAVQRLDPSATEEIALAAAVTIVFCHRGKILVGPSHLGSRDAVILEPSAAGVRLEADAAAVPFVVRIDPVSGGDQGARRAISIRDRVQWKSQE
jgi:environmental stress-induced protein Ves